MDGSISIGTTDTDMMRIMGITVINIATRSLGDGSAVERAAHAG